MDKIYEILKLFSILLSTIGGLSIESAHISRYIDRPKMTKQKAIN